MSAAKYQLNQCVLMHPIRELAHMNAETFCQKNTEVQLMQPLLFNEQVMTGLVTFLVIEDKSVKCTFHSVNANVAGSQAIKELAFNAVTVGNLEKCRNLGNFKIWIKYYQPFVVSWGKEGKGNFFL